MRIALPLSRNVTLAGSSRALGGTSANSLVEVLLLTACSLFAAMCVVVFEMKLRMPGHSIMRVIFPVSLGISLVPRRMVGGLVSFGAVGWLMLFTSWGWGRPGMGALTSLILIGPVLDACTWHSQSGWRLYLRCALAGMLTNALAFTVRAGGKAAGWDAFGMRPLSAWWSTAAVTHLAFGLVAGLLCAVLWFRLSTDRTSPETPSTSP